MKTISILGGGWLGLSLAIDLKKDFLVKISSHTIEKTMSYKEKGLFSFLFSENSVNSLDDLLNTNYLFINFPPSKFDNYLEFLNKIYNHPQISQIEKIIFVSSTSIYPDKDEIFNEDSFIELSMSEIVYEAEKLIKEKTNVIFRCAGLMGYDRIAGKYFSSKNVDSEDVKVNYVHRDDVISATKFVIQNDLEGIFNLCSKEHPSRKDIYLFNSKKYGFDEPIFINKKNYRNRIINAEKIERYGFKYKYSNPFDFI